MMRLTRKGDLEARIPGRGSEAKLKQKTWYRVNP